MRKFYPELAQTLLDAQANICKYPVSLARTETRLEDNTINNIHNSKLLTSQARFDGKMTNSLISSDLQRLLKFPITMSGEEGDWVHSDFQFRRRYLMSTQILVVRTLQRASCLTVYSCEVFELNQQR